MSSRTPLGQVPTLITDDGEALYDSFVICAYLAKGISIGHIAIGCAIGYLDLRFGHIEWRASRPKLAAWSEAFQQRPCMAGSQPDDPKKPFKEGDFRYILTQG